MTKEEVKDKLTALHELAQRAEVPVWAVCLNFARLNPDIDMVVIGVDNLDNLKQNIQALEYQDRVKNIYKDLLNLKESNENIILPTNWVKS